MSDINVDSRAMQPFDNITNAPLPMRPLPHIYGQPMNAVQPLEQQPMPVLQRDMGAPTNAENQQAAAEINVALLQKIRQMNRDAAQGKQAAQQKPRAAQQKSRAAQQKPRAAQEMRVIMPVPKGKKQQDHPHLRQLLNKSTSQTNKTPYARNTPAKRQSTTSVQQQQSSQLQTPGNALPQWYSDTTSDQPSGSRPPQPDNTYSWQSNAASQWQYPGGQMQQHYQHGYAPTTWQWNAQFQNNAPVQWQSDNSFAGFQPSQPLQHGTVPAQHYPDAASLQEPSNSQPPCPYNDVAQWQTEVPAPLQQPVEFQTPQQQPAVSASFQQQPVESITSQQQYAVSASQQPDVIQLGDEWYPHSDAAFAQQPMECQTPQQQPAVQQPDVIQIDDDSCLPYSDGTVQLAVPPQPQHTYRSWQYRVDELRHVGGGYRLAADVEFLQNNPQFQTPMPLLPDEQGTIWMPVGDNLDGTFTVPSIFFKVGDKFVLAEAQWGALVDQANNKVTVAAEVKQPSPPSESQVQQSR